MYEQYYGFSGRPFQLTPDPAFYFMSASHSKALSYLGYGMNQGEGFIVITGEVGAGKSTLVAHLMEKVDRSALTVAQVVTSALDGEELVHVVAQNFGLDVDGHDKASALGAIEAFLQDEARAGRRCLLVVDECQNLDVSALEELRMLSNFQLGSHPLLQGLLLGQPEFRETVAHHPDLDQLRQRIIASHHLDALDEDELDAYITHRLEHVGWENTPRLSKELLTQIYEKTDGIPRRVNQVMNRMLLLGAVEESDELTSEMLTSVCEEMMVDTAKGARHTTANFTMPIADEIAGSSTNSSDGLPAIQVAEMLAERDARTAELEAAIGDLQTLSAPIAGETDGEVKAAIERIEGRLDEQEQSFRHVVGMLIEWLEDDSSREAA
ncbi:MAG: XrtA/PEP-CTERM system-associated ATPase [Erythrobacter sp.]